jgi:hypothetical protein
MKEPAEVTAATNLMQGMIDESDMPVSMEAVRTKAKEVNPEIVCVFDGKTNTTQLSRTNLNTLKSFRQEAETVAEAEGQERDMTAMEILESFTMAGNRWIFKTKSL